MRSPEESRDDRKAHSLRGRIRPWFARFMRSENGATTVEWVAVTAGLILLTLGVLAAIQTGAVTTMEEVLTTPVD
jgi:Flp pilus assembly pilin Flp